MADAIAVVLHFTMMYALPVKPPYVMVIVAAPTFRPLQLALTWLLAVTGGLAGEHWTTPLGDAVILARAPVPATEAAKILSTKTHLWELHRIQT